MKTIKKVVFGFLMAAALCSFVACKSEGEKLADQSIALQKRAEKAAESGNLAEATKIANEIAELSKKVEKLTVKEAAKYAEKYEAYLEEDEEE